MASIRLYESQVNYLRERAGVDTLNTALERYRRGELVTDSCDFAKKSEKLLPFSLHRAITDYTGEQVRAILFAAMRNPVNYEREIRRFDDEINTFFDSFANQPFIVKEGH